MSNKHWSYADELNATVDEMDERLKPMTDRHVKITDSKGVRVSGIYPKYPTLSLTSKSQKPSWAQRAIPLLSLIGILSFLIGQIALDIYILYSIFTKTLNLTEFTCLVFIHAALLLSAYLFKHTHYRDQSN